MESTLDRTGHGAASLIDYEILRLKRELGSDDVKGHSCEQCNSFRIRPLVDHISDWKQNIKYKFSEIDTTGRKVRDLAEAGCDFWIMIRDQLIYIGLEAMIRRRKNKIALGSKIHHGPSLDDYWQYFAVSFGWEDEQEFRRLYRQRGVSWSFSAGATVEAPVTETDFVRIKLGYSYVGYLMKERPVTALVELIVPREAAGTGSSIWVPRRTDGALPLVQYRTEFLALKLPDVARNLFSGPINLMPQNPSSVALIKQWLKKCEVEHGCGIGLRPSQMPSMVLDVSDQDKIKLVKVHEDLRERYISLSYCWGKRSQRIMLSRSNRTVLASGVSVQQLDPTIRDSVIVTRQLGFKYLWVDALCVFQDDEALKARELGRMGEIYRNATLTIVASAAKDVQKGFLSKRKSTLKRTSFEFGRPGLVFEVQLEGDKEQSVQALPVILRPNELDTVEPWYERAWTLQEMLFSGRRLQYRANQTTWSCHCSETVAQQSDGWVGGRVSSYTNYSDASKIVGNTMAILRKGDIIFPSATVLATWYGLVEVYTKRKLTYPTDRLPAISGIAKHFESVLGDQYICGLWESDLPSGLVWYSIKSAGNSPGPKSRPSWSWASREGGAGWWRHMLRHWWRNPDFEVLGITVDLASASEPLGKVRTAELYVRGVLQSFSSFQSHFWRDKVAENLEDHMGGYLIFDDDNDPRVQPGSRSNLRLLVVVNGSRFLGGIVLVGEEDERRFSRVGCFHVDNIWLDMPGPQPVQTDERGRGRRSVEECKARIRDLWGGEESIQELVLV
ncbi:hypothetical protein KVR01_004028 [Diaporthe batatas]|uniref:uncharacterized protein n=1 Tax=Diaporthe batatas TaxID=748121 RepID=UPI001D057149|nr:uncharacterized protein KVR01_004028 [Diaporthe batatas]KAG8165476.1 hypothetical protein KVR01_004028 [Diaporthe batatas]